MVSLGFQIISWIWEPGPRDTEARRSIPASGRGSRTLRFPYQNLSKWMVSDVLAHMARFPALAQASETFISLTKNYSDRWFLKYWPTWPDIHHLSRLQSPLFSLPKPMQIDSL